MKIRPTRESKWGVRQVKIGKRWRKKCSNGECYGRAEGRTEFCTRHGGGNRCKYPGCDKGAQVTQFCFNHGGGKRCEQPGCDSSAGTSGLCATHMNDRLGIKSKRNKTQNMVRKYVEPEYDAMKEYRLEESGSKRFDFFIPGCGALLEIDGEQHFHDIVIGKSTWECSLPSDLIKQAAVKHNGMALIRVYQPWLWNMRAVPKYWHQAIDRAIDCARENPNALILLKRHKAIYKKHAQAWEGEVIYL